MASEGSSSTTCARKVRTRAGVSTSLVLDSAATELRSCSRRASGHRTRADREFERTRHSRQQLAAEVEALTAALPIAGSPADRRERHDPTDPLVTRGGELVERHLLGRPRSGRHHRRGGCRLGLRHLLPRLSHGRAGLGRGSLLIDRRGLPAAGQGCGHQQDQRERKWLLGHGLALLGSALTTSREEPGGGACRWSVGGFSNSPRPDRDLPALSPSLLPGGPTEGPIQDVIRWYQCVASHWPMPGTRPARHKCGARRPARVGW